MGEVGAVLSEGQHLEVELSKAGPVPGSGKGVAAAQQRARRVGLKQEGARANPLE
jgi:hypothetical protein